ncbi:unnamed protein product [Paramecium pentaurelia]|uniref:Uncharacterized protein n=1 Tax=Paramecium pentaurelia TaxID=43138 RepID=A0A8S1UUS5_9CILI|nr:unnamed protein product [Paramecium pentaurelia]
MDGASSKQQQSLDEESLNDENRESQNNIFFEFSVQENNIQEEQSLDEQSQIDKDRDSQNDSPQELPNQDNTIQKDGQKSQDQSSLNHRNQTSQENQLSKLPTKNQSKQTLYLYDDDGSILKKCSFNDEAIYKDCQVELHSQACSSPHMNEGDSQSNQDLSIISQKSNEDQFNIIYDQISQTPIIIEYTSNPNPIGITSPQVEQQFYPKTTKNYYKCIHGALQKFMEDIQDNIQFTCKAKKFLESNPQFSGKLKLIRSIKSCQQMRSIAMKFLLDFQWCRYLVKNNKVDIERYFRLNKMLIQQIQE